MATTQLPRPKDRYAHALARLATFDQAPTEELDQLRTQGEQGLVSDWEKVVGDLTRVVRRHG